MYLAVLQVLWLEDDWQMEGSLQQCRCGCNTIVKTPRLQKIPEI